MFPVTTITYSSSLVFVLLENIVVIITITVNVLVFVFVFYFCFARCFSGPQLWHMEVPWLGVELGATAMPDPSCVL